MKAIWKGSIEIFNSCVPFSNNDKANVVFSNLKKEGTYMKIKVSLLLILVISQAYASQGDLKSKGEQFKKRMNVLAQAQCDNIPRYRTNALKYLHIKVINAQRSGAVETVARNMAIIDLSAHMLVELRNFFPLSTLINDEKGRRDQAEYYFDSVYQQFQQHEADQKRVQAARKESRKRLAEIVHASNQLSQELRLQRFYARDEQRVNSLLPCCMSVEIEN